MEAKNNIGWVDLLRVLACFFVVFSHCCDAFVAQFDVNRPAFLTGVFAGSFMRPSVPLFVMMTGVLLLPLKPGTTLTGFYRKRIGRISFPLVGWSLLLPVLTYLYFTCLNPETQNPLITIGDYTASTLWVRLYTFIFNFNFDTVPLWYLYMLIGLYLFMPLLNSWLVQATRKELKTVLVIWGVSLLLPYIKMFAPVLGYRGNFGHMGIWGECDWNAYGTCYYLSGFMGYLLLAYYLMKYPLDWSWRKTLLITLPMFAVGYLITSVGYVITQEYFPGNYAYLEIIWYFTGINVFMMTFALFVIVQKIRVPSLPWLSRLASLCFGIYLCHYIFIFVDYDLFNLAGWPYIVRILCMACTTFAVSSLLAWVLSKGKFTGRFVK